MEDIKLTPTQKKALIIVRDTPGIVAAQIAKKLWPDSSMHTSSKNQGNGACYGKAAWLCGGSYMGKLSKKGWVRYDFPGNGYKLTSKGREIAETLT